MPVTWRSEACDQGADPDSGAFVVRLTQAARHSINIYQEQPYTSPDGRRVAIMRSEEADPRFSTHDLYVADLYTYRIQEADRGCRNYFIGTSAWSGILYYLSAANELCRLDITTLEKQIVWNRWPFPLEFGLQSVSPDHRFLVGALPQSNYKTAVIRVDLKEKTFKSIMEREDLFAAHLQYRPAPYADGRPGADILGMMHRGKKLNHLWDMQKTDHPSPGTGYYVMDNDGGNYRERPAGPPITGDTGHSAWVGDTGRVAFAAAWDTSSRPWKQDKRWPDGTLFTAAPGEKQPRCFRAPEHFFNHVSVSKCGRYFICDSYPEGVPGRTAIVVGNLNTGTYRELLRDCKATSGGPACSHAHPYMTADNKHVIYNADPHLIGQVYMARLADGFLESLN
jgi:hypothetical protein